MSSTSAARKYWPVIRFVLTVGIIYILWRGFATLMGAESQPLGERVFPALSYYWESFNDLIRVNLIQLSAGVLRFFDFETGMDQQYYLSMDGYKMVSVGNHCLAIQLWVLFAALVVSYPAPWKHKTWFIPAGIVGIHFLNVLRITALALLTWYYPEFLDFNHHFTFRVIVFGFILLIYLWFIRKFSAPKF